MINQKSDHIGAWNFQWLGQSLAEHASVCWDNGSCTRWSRLKQLMLSQIQQSANPGLQIEDYGIQGLHEKMILVGFPRSWPRRNQWNHWDWLKKGLIRLVFNHIIFTKWALIWILIEDETNFSGHKNPAVVRKKWLVDLWPLKIPLMSGFKVNSSLCCSIVFSTKLIADVKICTTVFQLSNIHFCLHYPLRYSCYYHINIQGKGVATTLCYNMLWSVLDSICFSLM